MAKSITACFLFILLLCTIPLWTGLGENSIQKFQIEDPNQNIYDCHCTILINEATANNSPHPNSTIYFECDSAFTAYWGDDYNCFNTYMAQKSIFKPTSISSANIYSASIICGLVCIFICCWCMPRYRDHDDNAVDFIFFYLLVLAGIICGIYFIVLPTYLQEYNQNEDHVCYEFLPNQEYGDCADFQFLYVEGTMKDGDSLLWWLIFGIICLSISTLFGCCVPILYYWKDVSLKMDIWCRKPYKTCPSCNGGKGRNVQKGAISCSECDGNGITRIETKKCPEILCEDGYIYVEETVRTACIECLGTGKIKTRQMAQATDCVTCGGNGCFANKENKRIACHKCNGTGEVQNRIICGKCGGNRTIQQHGSDWVQCGTCNGKGAVHQGAGCCYRCCRCCGKNKEGEPLL